MNKRGVNQVASVHQRLLNMARSSGRPFNELLQYYAIERFLYRLSRSTHAGRFILKGALTLLVWQMPVTRPTRDIDLLGRLSNDLEAVRAVIVGICQQAVEDDGLTFDATTVTTQRTAEDADYQGVRAPFLGYLGKARIPMQIDIGFSDVITPAPIPVHYPAMLGQPSAELMAYNRETSIAKKLEAMVSLGQLNSRMKDFFDIWLLARTYDFDARVLAEAISRTFAQRQTPVQADPVCFTASFARDAAKTAQWAAFISTSRLSDAPADFAEVVSAVQAFLEPVAQALVQHAEFAATWHSPGPWHQV